jgi:2,4-dienoyl-CoA reductase-like NADH-dependent reductase (Old Yellow Enzyme family)
MTKILSNRQLEIKTLKSINTVLRHEKNKMVELANELIKNENTPIEWRKKQSNDLLMFIIQNRYTEKSKIIERLKEIDQ